jgi:hypothetical protein
MKTIREYFPSTLIGLPLLGVALSSFWVIRDVNRSLGGGEKIAFHEVGYARLALGVLGLLILVFPFRNHRRWSWFALLLFEMLYLIPSWVLPFGSAYSDFLGLIAKVGGSELARIALENLAAAVCMLTGLALSFGQFFLSDKTR